jgi:nucleoside-diphosphate-sugar epimerase
MLGRAVAQALAARGDEVTVLQRGASGLPLREVRTDLGDPAVPLAPALAGQDAVVHLAAKVDVVGPWREYARTNVDGTRRLLVAARAAGVGRFVHVSSPSVAHAGAALVGEGAGPADPARARGHYARSKALAEQLVLDAARPPSDIESHANAELAYRNAQLAGPERATRRAGTRNLPSTNAQLAGPERATRRAETRDSPAVVVVRPHLVWGPGDTQLVGRIVARAQAGRLAVVGTGAALIDTTYVDDAVDALVAALDRAPGLHERVFVVSGGEPRPVAELLASICAAAGAPAPRIAVPAPVARAAGAVVETLWRHDPPMTRFLAEQLSTAHWFDQRETRAALGWAPRVGLEEGFRRLRAVGSW